MSRPPRPRLLSKNRTLQTIWSWYEFQRALIGEEKARVLTGLFQVGNIGPSRYVGKTQQELEVDFAEQLDELNQLTMFALLAYAEAALRTDFLDRVENRKKDSVSRRFREISKKRGKRIRLEEDILDTWRELGNVRGTKPAIARFKDTLRLRDWLAHGRYWQPKLGRTVGYQPLDIFDICLEILQATNLIAPDSGT